MSSQSSSWNISQLNANNFDDQSLWWIVQKVSKVCLWHAKTLDKKRFVEKIGMLVLIIILNYKKNYRLCICRFY